MANKSRGTRAERRHPSGGPDMKKLYLILGIVAVVGIAIVGFSITSERNQASTMPVPVEGLDDPQKLVALAQGLEMGDDSAPIKIVEFGDYMCPGCGYFATNITPLIEETYVKTGKAKFVFYDYPLVASGHVHSFLAARAVRCAAEHDKGWELHHTLYANQGQWSSLNGDPSGQFVDYAGQLGLDEGSFRGCLMSDRYADVVSANLRLGEELGVSGTPTVMISEGGGMAQRLTLGGDIWGQITAAVDGILEARGIEGSGTGGGDGSGG